MKLLNRKKHIVSIAALLAVILLGFNNCSQVEFHGDVFQKALRPGETIVGNPMTAAASNVLTKACSLVTRCHPTVTASRCESEILKLSSIDYQLGLATGSVKNYSEIIQSENEGRLFANTVGTKTCLAEIEKINCSDSTAQGAYNAATDSFAGVAFLIPTTPGSCPAIFSQPAALTEYHVAVNGSDTNDGSSDRPWATITHASQALSLGAEGTTVHVGPGNYSLPVSLNCAADGSSCGVKTNRSGTSTAPITYISDQPGAAKITAPGASAAWYNSGDHVRIIGFEIQGSPSSNFGILSEAAFGKMIGNHIHSIPVTNGCAVNRAGGGIFFGYLPSAHDNDAIGNRIHDIGPRLPNGLPQASYCQGMALGIAYDQPRGKIQNNIIYSVDSWGISTWHAVSDLQISHNLLFNNGNVAGNGTPMGGAIFMSGEAAVGVHNGTTVSNNIIRNNSGKGINEFASVGPGNAYLNNLMFSNTRDFDLISGVVPQGTVTANPLMVNFTLDGSGDYRLTALSPAVDAGTSNCVSALSPGCTPALDLLGVLRPLGGVLDIGPYEWHP